MRFCELTARPAIFFILTFRSKCFPALSEQEKYEFLNDLGRLPCAINGSLTVTIQSNPDSLGKESCHICDDELQSHIQSDVQVNECDVLCQVLAFIVPKISRSSTIRVTAMATLKRILMHTSSPIHLKLSGSIFGDFLLGSLRSSVRELRVIAGYAPRD